MVFYSLLSYGQLYRFASLEIIQKPILFHTNSYYSVNKQFWALYTIRLSGLYCTK